MIFVYKCCKRLTILFLLSISNDISASYLDDISRCELQAIGLGSEIADAFNAPIRNENWNQRVHQNRILELLGFAPWLASGVHGSGGKTLTNENARDIHAHHGWIGKAITDSPYRILNHKWIYMFGDSTTRQIWASYAAPFQGNNFIRNSKEWTRQYVRQAN